MIIKRIVFALIFLQCGFSNSQSLRGLSVLNDSLVWVSGSKGFIGKYDKDSFNPSVLSSEYQHKDFRDIHGFNEKVAIAMSVADSGVLLKTRDGGNTWVEVFRDNDSGVFFDVIELTKNGEFGILLGDPLLSKPDHLYFRLSVDSGNHWITVENGQWNKISPKLNSLYAASGTSARILDCWYNEITGLLSLKIIIGGGGDKGASIRMAEVNWNIEGHLQSEKVTNLSVPMPEEKGWGVYGLSEPIDGQIAVAGGHWKYPDGRPIEASGSTSNITECDNGLFLLKYNIDNALTLKPLRVCNYLSGATLVDNDLIIAVGSNGLNQVKFPRKKNDPNIKLTWEFPLWKIQDFIIERKSSKVTVNTEELLTNPFKGLNAVGVSDSFVWIIGVSKTPKIIKIPLNRW